MPQTTGPQKLFFLYHLLSIFVPLTINSSLRQTQIPAGLNTHIKGDIWSLFSTLHYSHATTTVWYTCTNGYLYAGVQLMPIILLKYSVVGEWAALGADDCTKKSVTNRYQLIAGVGKTVEIEQWEPHDAKGNTVTKVHLHLAIFIWTCSIVKFIFIWKQNN